MTWPTLSLHQPWAWAIVTGNKRIENRSWKTPYRGPLFIHAGKTYDRGAAEFLEESVGIVLGGDEHRVLGCVVGAAILAEITSDHSEGVLGMWHWRLIRPVMFESPVPARGRLGLFQCPELEEFGALDPQDAVRLRSVE